MKKVSVLSVLFLSVLTGCSSKPSVDVDGKPEIFSDKGFFEQDKTKSIAANLTAFAGYPFLVSDHDMPTSLRRGLDFTSGTYVGFNSFGSLWGAAGLGGLSMLIGDNIAPFTPSSTVLMVPLQPGEQYYDLSVAKRAIENNVEKIDGSTLTIDSSSAAYKHQLQRLEFSKNKSMNGITCTEAGMAEKMIRHNDANCGIENYNIEVFFSRPAKGNEFPELKQLPTGNYAVLLLNLYSNYQLRKDAPWAASFDDTKKSFKFHDFTLPYLSPDKTGKRILIEGQGDETKILYK